MKKIIGLAFFALGLTGCFISGEVTKDTVLRDEHIVVESSLPDEENVKKEENLKDNEIIKNEEDVYGEEVKKILSMEEKADLLRQQQGMYAFSTLEVTGQNLYVEMLYALTNYVEEMEVSTTDTDEIDKIFQCVMLDHPEIFYADGYSFVKYTLGEEVKKITFTGTYVYSKEERAVLQNQIDQAVESILQGIDPQATAYDKVKYVYEWIINHTEYDMEAADNQNICSVFLYGKSVCQGYAKSAQYLLAHMDVPVALVIGTVGNGEGHAWNLVSIDNEYYYMDTTWGDASYLVQSDSGTMAEYMPEINYDYLCVNTEELLRTHVLSELIPLPHCRSLEANYYVQEGAYFTQVDWKQLENLINRYKEEGRETVTLKCSKEDIYQGMLEELLGEQKIFEYLKPEGDSILYTNSESQLSITFWL